MSAAIPIIRPDGKETDMPKKAEPAAATIGLRASAPTFKPAYVAPTKDVVDLIGKGNKKLSSNTPVPPESPPLLGGGLSEELGLDFTPRSTMSIYAKMSNSLITAMEKQPDSSEAATPKEEKPDTRRRTGRSRAANSAVSAAAKHLATKRAATKPVPDASPHKKQRSASKHTPPPAAASEVEQLLGGLPMARSGVSNLFDDLDLKPIAAH